MNSTPVWNPCLPLRYFSSTKEVGNGLVYPKNRLNGLVLHLEAEKIIKNVILLRINVLGVNYVIPVVLKNVST